jgi:hypothetical protein
MIAGPDKRTKPSDTSWARTFQLIIAIDFEIFIKIKFNLIC